MKKNKIWECNDFIYKDDIVLGFSEKGKKKILENKYLQLPFKTDEDVTVHKIGKYAFKNCGIEEVDFSNSISIQYIDNYAFMGNKIQEIDLTMCLNLKEIGIAAFLNNKIKRVDFHNMPELSSISKFAFSNNEITDIDFIGCSALFNIADNAFYQNKIKKLDFTNCFSLSVIGNGAFKSNEIYNLNLEKCNNLKFINSLAFGNNDFRNAVITLPSNIEVLSFYAFSDNPSPVLFIQNTGYDSKILSDGDNYFVDTSYENFLNRDIGNGWTIKDFTYEGSTLTGLSKTGKEKIKNNKSLYIPNLTSNFRKVKSLKEYAFCKCGIQEVYLNKSLEYINNYAFEDNDLKYIDFSRSPKIKYIGPFAFTKNKITDKYIEEYKADKTAFV